MILYIVCQSGARLSRAARAHGRNTIMHRLCTILLATGLPSRRRSHFAQFVPQFPTWKSDPRAASAPRQLPAINGPLSKWAPRIKGCLQQGGNAGLLGTELDNYPRGVYQR